MKRFLTLLFLASTLAGLASSMPLDPPARGDALHPSLGSNTTVTTLPAAVGQTGDDSSVTVKGVFTKPKAGVPIAALEDAKRHRLNFVGIPPSLLVQAKGKKEGGGKLDNTIHHLSPNEDVALASASTFGHVERESREDDDGDEWVFAKRGLFPKSITKLKPSTLGRSLSRSGSNVGQVVQRGVVLVRTASGRVVQSVQHSVKDWNERQKANRDYDKARSRSVKKAVGRTSEYDYDPFDPDDRWYYDLQHV